MDKLKLRKIFLPLLFLFIIINGSCFFLADWLDEKNINHLVLMGANVLLFFLAVLSIWMFARAVENPNPNVFVRTVMAATFIKLMVIAFATIIYFLLAKENKSLYAILVSMVLYILYTIIEIKGAFRINKTGNAKG